MSFRESFFLTALVLLGLLPTPGLPAPMDPVEQGDEKLLQDARVGTDGPGLLAFFRRRTPTTEDEKRLHDLVRQLGDRRFAAREKASRELVERGVPALGLLRDVLNDPDREIARRAAICIAEIERGPGPALPAAAARVLARRAPAEAVAVLLAYLPFADDANVTEEVLAALVAVGTRPGKVDPALTAALKDTASVRRAAAGYTLGRHPDRAARESAVPLLTDREPTVRLRAAQGLIAGKDSQAVPVVIALLAEAPAEMASQAEEMLWRLAGDRSPARPPGNDAREYRELWSRWWRDHGKEVDLARLAEQPPQLGFTLIAHSNKVWEWDRAGKVRWTIGDLNMPIEAMVLPGGRVLVVENAARRVSERDLTGKILWEYQTPDQALSARRLPNGNLFVSTNSTVAEVTREGKEVYRHRFPAPGAGGSRINSACRLRSGRLLVLTDDGSMVEVDPTTGKILATHRAPDQGTYSVEPLPNGGWLAAGYGVGKVVEYDASGKSVWEYTFPSAFHALRLPNGNTLITSHGGRKMIEVTRDRQVVREQSFDDNVWRAHRR